MANQQEYDVIIIGGSYTGLSAAMALGRALKKVLVIDGVNPCNKQTPHSHNFLTQDGKTPKEISELAKAQVANYKTVSFLNDIAIKGEKSAKGFEITTQNGLIFKGRKLIFGTGIKDQMPNIEGFAECWGISAIHCPYCHGYEVRHLKTGLFANGDMAYEFGKLLWNWTKDLTIYTNGKSTLNAEQTNILASRNIHVVEKEIVKIAHNNGQIQELVFTDGSSQNLDALYAKIPFVQHSDIPQSLGCELTEMGMLKVDMMQKTTLDGVFAAGDNTSPMRSVANAVYGGNMAGAAVSKELIAEDFGVIN
ncbi:NAD(P)/FAD-dependent oxidoreductase [Pedobacter sp. SL55]|uniref:NAD(P)/FAD-dependent oxidoreductase n=1 Tax=Pedobacter sp. SL55 TaxID=2995161 RepID=UPI0022702713|nr:NAD(P)/FAD-dependent oxidoreductase [Pedobacter sp. SL55]WAC39334.1 NAD(P)/FAD-dependent oxidoreductase [Pedobacter sp. SL55]